MKVRLFYMGQDTHKARRYSKVPSSRNPEGDTVWIPASIIEHVQKWPVKDGENWPEHILTLPDWFGDKI